MVVLPEPFGPRTTQRWSGSTRQLTSSRMRSPSRSNPTAISSRAGTAEDGSWRCSARPLHCSAMRPLVVLPTYNEAANIVEVLTRVRQAAPEADVLVVDDASPDGTADLAEEAAGRLGQIHLLRRPGKSGLGNAYRSGFRWGLERGYDAFVEMDSDLSHDPAALPSLLGGLEAADLVIGSRYVPGGSIPQWGLHRRLLSEAGNRYASLMLGMKVRDLTSGYRAYDGDTLRLIDLDRVEGQSKMSMRTIVEALALVTVWGVRRVLGRRSRAGAPTHSTAA